MMLQSLIEGTILGLSTGITCLGTCTPIYIPYLLTEDRKLGKSFLKVGEISLGRFFSYIAFGAMAGFAGKNIATVNREIFTSIAYILLSIYLILSAYRTHKKCNIPGAMKATKNAFILGILTGINFCPAFLIALSKSVNLGGVVSGMLLFFGFFLGTSVFLVPLAFANLLSHLKGMKSMARYASIGIAIWFIIAGSRGIYHWINARNANKINDQDKRIVEVFSPHQEIFTITNSKNQDYFIDLDRQLQNATADTINITLITADIDWNLIVKAKDPILFIDKQVLSEQDIGNNISRFDHFVIEKGFDVNRIIVFLKKYTFQTSKFLDWKFENEEKE